MKLHRLDLQAFGPFRARQTIDFDAFDADGLFLISGRTGAGKSSILDGVCYALYGTAPRYDGGDRGLRSDHAEPDEVTLASLEFTAGGARWRVTRTPEYERPKARGTGTTTQKSTVLVEQWSGGDWIGRATKYREAAEVLDGILGLDRDQFQQVILLAQNRFAQFLLAKNDERQALLRTLFGSRRYEEYEKEFDRRRREAQASLDGAHAARDAHLVRAESLISDHLLAGADADEAAADVVRTMAERLESTARAVMRADYRADEAARGRTEAETRHNEALTRFGQLSTLRARQDQRIASRAALAELEARVGEIAAKRQRLARAQAAEILRAPVEASARAAATAALASAALDTALGAWRDSGESDLDRDELGALIDELGAHIAVWSTAAEIEAKLPGLAIAVADSDRGVASIEAALAEGEQAARERAGRLALIEPELHALESDPRPVEPARAALAAADERLAAGREAARLAEAVAVADRSHSEAADALDEAGATVKALLRRRLDGYAGELAGTLGPDSPCPVCGSAEHPHPAVPSDEPVTDAVIAAAEGLVAQRADGLRTASATAAAARREHQDAVARAGGEGVDELESARAAALASLDDAIAHTAAHAKLRDERLALASADREHLTAKERLTADLIAARERRVEAARAEEVARAAVDEARGTHASVATRVDAVRRRRLLAQALSDALEASRTASDAARDVDADLAERLASSPFSTAGEVNDGLLSADERTATSDAVRRHEVAVASERERLLALETELAGVSEDLIDLDAAGAETAQARETWIAAVTEAEATRSLASQLADVVGRATALEAESADATAEHEIIAGLADAIAGRTEARMDLETFVLAAELEEIVNAANLRLDTMSAGRYRLRHSDAVGRHRAASGLGLSIDDAYTGQSRQAQSLSGGETFLASLALALGLAEVVTARAGGVRLDTLFIDEGFGSLDDETLELAMRTLDELRQGGRTVGLISHVAAMKEQLPAQLLVEATPQGPSVVRQGAAIAA